MYWKDVGGLWESKTKRKPESGVQPKTSSGVGILLSSDIFQTTPNTAQNPEVKSAMNWLS